MDLQQIIAEYYRLADACSADDRELARAQIIVDYCDFEDELLQYFEDEDALAFGQSSKDETALKDDVPPEKFVIETEYSAVSKIGAGGMGVIYQAREKDPGRDIAVKMIRTRLSGNSEGQARFLRESAILADLDHPGTVPVYAQGRAKDGRLFYSMKLLSGNTLRDAIVAMHQPGGNAMDVRRRVVLKELLRRFVSVCNTVAYAHSRGYVHRDIKPDNVMLRDYNETILIDWGLARRLRPEGDSPADDAESTGKLADDVPALETTAGSSLGTLGYMSPEQISSPNVGPSSDVYSLGATLYEILTGDRPLASLPADEIQARTLAGEIEAPRKQNRRIPQPLNAICVKAMRLESQGRYATAIELAEEIERYLDDEPIKTCREPVLTRFRRFANRHQSIWIAIGLVILVLAGLAGVLSFPLLRSVRSAREAAHQIKSVSDMGAIMYALPLTLDRINDTNPAPGDEDIPSGLSWRVHILPELGYEELYRQFNLQESWDSDWNRLLIDKMPPVFAGFNTAPASGETCYLMPQGDGLFLPTKRPVPPLDSLSPVDGPDRTVALLEVDRQRSVIWTKPEDYHFVAATPLEGLCADWSDKRLLVALANGSTRTVYPHRDTKSWHAILTLTGGEDVAVENLEAKGSPLTTDAGMSTVPSRYLQRSSASADGQHRVLLMLYSDGQSSESLHEEARRIIAGASQTGCEIRILGDPSDEVLVTLEPDRVLNNGVALSRVLDSVREALVEFQDGEETVASVVDRLKNTQIGADSATDPALRRSIALSSLCRLTTETKYHIFAYVGPAPALTIEFTGTMDQLQAARFSKINSGFLTEWFSPSSEDSRVYWLTASVPSSLYVPDSHAANVVHGVQKLLAAAASDVLKDPRTKTYLFATVAPRLDKINPLQIIHFDAAIVGLNPLSNDERQALTKQFKDAFARSPVGINDFFARDRLGSRFLIRLTGESEDHSTTAREIADALRTHSNIWVSDSTFNFEPRIEVDDARLARFHFDEEDLSLATGNTAPIDLSASLRVVVRLNELNIPFKERRVRLQDGGFIALPEIAALDSRRIGLVPLDRGSAFCFYGILTDVSTSKVHAVERIAHEVATKHSLSATVSWTVEGDLSFPRP